MPVYITYIKCEECEQYYTDKHVVCVTRKTKEYKTRTSYCEDCYGAIYGILDDEDDEGNTPYMEKKSNKISFTRTKLINQWVELPAD